MIKSAMTRYVRPSYMPKFWPIPADCVLYYEGQQDAYSSTIRDLSGGGYHGTLTGATWTRTSKGLWVNTFDGNDLISRTVANFRSADSSGAIEVWFRTSAAGGGSYLFGSADEASTTRFLGFGTDVNKLYLEQRNNDTLSFFRGTATISDGKRHHAVVSSDGDVWTLFLDGQIDAIVLGAGSNNGDWFADTSARDNIISGALKTTGTSQFFTGDIGLVRIYSRPMLQPEAAGRFNQERILFGV